MYYGIVCEYVCKQRMSDCYNTSYTLYLCVTFLLCQNVIIVLNFIMKLINASQLGLFLSYLALVVTNLRMILKCSSIIQPRDVKTKGADQLHFTAVNAQLISAFAFTTKIVQSLYIIQPPTILHLGTL